MAGKVRTHVATYRDFVGFVLALLGFLGAWLFFGAIFLWTGVSELRRGFTPVDVSARCSTTVSGRCFSDQWALVESVDSAGYVYLTYDDGRRTEYVALVDDSQPEPGTRLRIEYWGETAVSLYDPGREIRHRTDEWPRRRDVVESVLLAVVGFALLAPLLAGIVIGIAVRLPRRRRLTADSAQTPP